MTDDIRERAARDMFCALYQSEPQPEILWDLSPNKARWIEAMGAVLSAIQYREIREALEEQRFALLRCANAIKRIGDDTAEFGSVTDDVFWDDLWKAETEARAALAKEGA